MLIVDRNHKSPGVVNAGVELDANTPAAAGSTADCRYPGQSHCQQIDYQRQHTMNGFFFACMVAVVIAVAESSPNHVAARFLAWKGWDRFSAVGFQAYFTGPVSGVIACSLLMPNVVAPTVVGFYTLVPVMLVVNYTFAFGVAKLVVVANKIFSEVHAMLCCSAGAAWVK